MPTKIPRIIWTATALTLIAPSARPDSRNVHAVTPPTGAGKFVFSLLPRTFNRSALVDMTVYGEVTNDGRSKSPPKPDSPIYCVIQNGGYVPDRRGPQARHIPPQARIADQVTRSLTKAGYSIATEDKKPEIIVIYSWGSQYGGLPRTVRASLVGGAAFAKEIDTVYARQRTYIANAESMVAAATPRPLDMPSPQQPPGGNENLGAATRPAIGFFSFKPFQPLQAYERENENNAILLEHLSNDFYYVIISAYDYSEALNKKNVLLWRTHLTVDATGVSFEDTLPALLTASVPYLGKDTDRPGTLTQKMLRTGTVEFGPAEIVEENVKTEKAP